MKLQFIILLTTFYVAQAILEDRTFEERSDFDYFVSLSELEDPLRNEDEKFEICYKLVKPQHEEVLKTFSKEVTEFWTKTYPTFRPSRDAVIYGNQAFTLFRELIRNLNEYPKKIVKFVEKRNYRDAANLVFNQRKEAEAENKKFDDKIERVGKIYPNVGKKVIDKMNKIRDDVITKMIIVSTNFTICIEETPCSPNVGFVILK